MRRRTACLSLWLVLFAVLAPALSQAIAAATGAEWVEVCTSSGLKRIALDADDPPGIPAHDADASTHCPFCRLHDDVPAVLTASVAAAEPGAAACVLPARPASQDISATWRPAHPRAPPSLLG